VRRFRLDIALIAAGTLLILAATLLQPSPQVSDVAGIVGFLLVIGGAYVTLRDFGRGGGGRGGGGGSGGWLGGPGEPPSGGHGGHHGGGFGGAGHGGGGGHGGH
jgi:hypothetical protein